MPTAIRLLLTVLCFTPSLAQAGPCDALFRFDRNLNDAGPNSYNGQMVGPEGVAATPQFVEGKFGQALRLDGTSVMRTFIDLHPDVCPQVTLTALVQIEGEANNQTQFFVSSGSYRGPGMYISGTSLTQAGSGNGQHQSDAIRKGANWTFVAASYDNPAGKYRLHWRTRSKEMAMGSTTPPEEAVWIGAFDDKLGHPAKGIVLDDVQIIGRVISHDEFLAMQNSPAAGASTAVDTSGGKTVAEWNQQQKERKSEIGSRIRLNSTHRIFTSFISKKGIRRGVDDAPFYGPVPQPKTTVQAFRLRRSDLP